MRRPMTALRPLRCGRSCRAGLLGMLLAALLVSGCGRASDPLSQARELIERKDGAAALVAVKGLLQQQPDLAEARLMLGTLLLDAGQPQAAEIELRRALSLGQPEPVVVPLLARALLQARQAQALVAQFGQTTWPQASAATAELKTTLADAQAQLGQWPAAENSLAQALQAKPGYEPALRLRVRVLAAGGDLPGALARLDALLATHPGSADAWVLKGDLMARQAAPEADPALRLQAYQQALKLQPAHLGAHAALVSWYLGKRDVAAARAQHQLMREQLPRHPQTALYEGQLAFLDGDLQKAREIFQRLRQRLPDNLMLLQSAGVVELRLKAPAQAEQLLAQAQQLAPDNPAVRRLLAQAHLAQGQPDRALAALAPLIGPRQADAEALGLAAQAKMVAGDASAADALFQRAVKLRPDDPRARTALALSQLGRGQTDSALADLQRVAAADSGTSADLAMIAVHMGRQAWAPALQAIAGLDRKQPGAALPAHLRGQVLQRQKDLAGARDAYTLALQRDANYLPAVAALANLDIADRRPEAARARYEALVKAQPKNTLAHLALAELGVRTGLDRASVSALLETGIAANPEDATLRLALVDHHVGTANLALALQTAQAGLAALPDQPDLLSRLGQVQLRSGDRQQALTTFNRLVQLQPRSLDGHLGLAQAQLGGEDLAGARRSLDRVLELRPDHLPAQRLLTSLLQRRQKPDEALAVARQVQTQRPDEAAGWLLEGELELARQRWPQAVAALRQASAKAEPGLAPVRLHHALRQAGQTAEAESLAKAWPQSHPRDILFLFYLGDVALTAKDLAAAEARYRAVLAVSPTHALSLNNVAWLLLQQNKPGARPLAEQAVKSAPDSAALRDTLAQALAAEGQLPQAVTMQESAVALKPEDPFLRLNLARWYAQTSQKRQAKAELDRLAAMGDRFPRQAEVAALLKSLGGRS